VFIVHVAAAGRTAVPDGTTMRRWRTGARRRRASGPPGWDQAATVRLRSLATKATSSQRAGVACATAGAGARCGVSEDVRPYRGAPSGSLASARVGARRVAWAPAGRPPPWASASSRCSRVDATSAKSPRVDAPPEPPRADGGQRHRFENLRAAPRWVRDRAEALPGGPARRPRMPGPPRVRGG
jgi:hypothetical protein